MFTSKLEDQPTSTNSKREQILQEQWKFFSIKATPRPAWIELQQQQEFLSKPYIAIFKTKNDFFIALIERVTIHRFQIELGLEELPLNTTSLHFQGNPERLLRKLAEVFMGKMSDQEYLSFFRLVIAESARFPELAKLYSRTVIQQAYQALSQYLESHPELRIPDPEATARIFLGSLVSFVLSQEILFGKDTMPIDQNRFIDSLVHLILNHPKAEVRSSRDGEKGEK